MDERLLKKMLADHTPAGMGAAADLLEESCQPSSCTRCGPYGETCGWRAHRLRYCVAWFEPILYSFAYRQGELTVPLEECYLARQNPTNLWVSPRLSVHFRPATRTTNVALVWRSGGGAKRQHLSHWLHYPRRGKAYAHGKAVALAMTIYAHEPAARPDSGEFKWGQR